MLFSAHPSRCGIAQGTLDSGSTGWEGKVRSRLVLHDPAVEEDEDGESFAAQMLSVARNPSDERVLTRAKSNYAAPGEQIPPVLHDGAFHPKNIDPATARVRGPMRDLEVDAKFIELMSKVNAAGAYVNDSRSVPHRYAPKVFARHPYHSDITENEFAKAMRRLFGKRIRLIETSRKGRTHLEFCACIVSYNQCATAALKVDDCHLRVLTPRTSRIE